MPIAERLNIVPHRSREVTAAVTFITPSKTQDGLKEKSAAQELAASTPNSMEQISLKEQNLPHDVVMTNQ